MNKIVKYIINKRPHVNPTFRFIKDIAKSMREREREREKEKEEQHN